MCDPLIRRNETRHEFALPIGRANILVVVIKSRLECPLMLRFLKGWVGNERIFLNISYKFTKFLEAFSVLGKGTKHLLVCEFYGYGRERNICEAERKIVFASFQQSSLTLSSNRKGNTHRKKFITKKMFKVP